MATGSLVHVVVVCLVLSATLFGLRRLAADWRRSRDHVRPATHVVMGAAMSYTMLVPQVLPVFVGLAMLAAVALMFCQRALVWWSTPPTAQLREPLATPGMTMMAVMAVMFMGTERDSILLTLALLGCLGCCAIAYGRPLLRAPRSVRAQLGDVGPPLVLTAGMAAMLVLP